MYLLRLDARLHQLGRHLVRLRRGVLEHELAGVGHEADVQRLGERLVELDAELAGERVDDLRRARRLRHDQVHVPEARVVVVVVDVDYADAVGLQELNRHPVHVPAVKEYDKTLGEVLRRLVQNVVEPHAPVLVRERELVRAHVHHGVLAELLHQQLHRAEGPEGVAVRVLVGGEQEAVAGPDLLGDEVEIAGHELGRPAHSSSNREMRAPRSALSS